MGTRSQSTEPSLVIVNARIWTGAAAVPSAEAVAITGIHLTALGSNDEIRALAGPRTRVVDAVGRRLIPGITDSHTHLLWAGEQLLRLDLRDARGKKDFINRVADSARQLPAGRWLRGGAYAVEHWPQPEQPRKEWIDAVTPDTPVYLTRADLHMALANSRALNVAGITRDGPADPPGGEIERDAATGEPTGIVKDAAMGIVEACLPAPTQEENKAALQAATDTANAWGITSIHDMSWPEHVAAYAHFRAQQRLSLRTFCYWTTVDFAAAWQEMQQYNTGDEMLNVVGYKAFMDGSLGSRTAYFREPYTNAAPDAKYPRGLLTRWTADMDAFRASVRWAHERKVPVAIHAIGDQAVHGALDSLAAVPEPHTCRHRIEHTQHLLPEDVDRFAILGVIASMQPIHKEDDGPWAISAVGPERLKWAYPWGTLLRAGAILCFGSDVPVATNNPYAGIRQAVTGRMPDGSTCTPEQNITREQALRCYTVTPPFAVFREHDLGVIAAGRRADLALLDHDILECDVDELPETKADLTIVNGDIVWPRDGSDR